MKMNPFITDHPIPGESLTNSPDRKLPYETPPEVLTVQEGMEKMWQSFTKKETIPQLLRMLRRDIPVSDIANVTVMAGISEGKWTQDLAVQLLQPTMLMIMDIAHRANVEYVFSKELPSLKAEMDNEKKTYLENKLKENAPPADEGLMAEMEGEEEVGLMGEEEML